MIKIFLTFITTIFLSASAFSQWKPNKPINIIVPWAAGGVTDQMIRITAGDLEAELGQKIIVLNQPGASGSIGTKNALEAPKDDFDNFLFKAAEKLRTTRPTAINLFSGCCLCS